MGGTQLSLWNRLTEEDGNVGHQKGRRMDLWILLESAHTAKRALTELQIFTVIAIMIMP